MSLEVLIEDTRPLAFVGSRYLDSNVERPA